MAATAVDFASGDVVELLQGAQQLETILQSANARSQLVLVDYFATWCGPCRMLAPVLVALAREHAGRLVVVKVDCEKTEANQSLARSAGISAFPTLHLHREMQRVGAVRGADVAALRQAVAAQLEQLGPGASAPGAMAAALAQALGCVKASCPHEEFMVATTTLLAFVNNVLNHPDDPKYRRIKLANPAFHSKLGSKLGGVQCMEALGFRQHSEAMESLLVMSSISPQLQATKMLLEQALAAAAPVAAAPAPVLPAAVVPAAPALETAGAGAGAGAGANGGGAGASAGCAGAGADVDSAALARALAQAMAPPVAGAHQLTPALQRRVRVTPQMLARQLEKLLLEGGFGRAGQHHPPPSS